MYRFKQIKTQANLNSAFVLQRLLCGKKQSSQSKQWAVQTPVRDSSAARKFPSLPAS